MFIFLCYYNFSFVSKNVNPNYFRGEGGKMSHATQKISEKYLLPDHKNTALIKTNLKLVLPIVMTKT